VMPTNPRGVALPIAANGHKLVAVSQSTGGSVEWVRFYDVTNYNAISNNYPWITIWNFNSGSGAAASGQRGLNSPSFIYFDSTVNQTFVSDSGNNRIGIWPGTAGSFDQPMLDVVGHSDASGSQYSFIASAANNPNELNLDSPTQATADTRNQHLFVADSGNNRVLVYSLDPNTFKPTSGIATNVIGVALQPTGIPMLDSRAPGSNSTVTAGTLNNPTQVALDPAGRLWVADTGNNRVLRFPTATPSLPVNGISADLVLGQPDFGSFAAGTGLNQMSAPGGIAFDASTDRLYVSDTGNNRILVFNTMSTVTNGATATCFGNSTFAVPIGQCVGGHSGGVNLNALDAPGALWYTNGSSGAVARGLFVADTGNHRVLYYDLTATVNGLPSNAPLSPATMCYGHHGATLAAACSSSLPNDGGTLATKGGFGLSAPTSVFFRETSPPRLFVADKGNARVAVYDFSDCKNSPFSTGGAPCGGVTVFNNSTIFHAIGGRSVTTSFGGPVATPAGLNTPMGVFGLSPSSSPNLLYITDQIWNRVGVYEVP
ncbi:MAG: NHL repeat-containing protein, partial [Deltaproteobacteria bacterium]|nr:NHL repeat-containing protein [Deltaproteobacteria bacterium]